jgi:gluconokinase
VILIVAGVAGSGKTTVGALVAGNLHWKFVDADSLHPASNIEKMREGIPLTDEDRAPWLAKTAALIDERIEQHQPTVFTCSALKRSYRYLLLHGRPEAQMVFLRTDREELTRRLLARRHFFPSKLLDSQFAILEPPQPGEHIMVVSSVGDANETAALVLEKLRSSGFLASA